MRYFILVMKEFPRIVRQEIDEGSMKQEAITLVNCIRSSFFTSHGVRKDVNVILYPSETSDRLIVIEGEKLRYMGPDERSMSILLSMSANKLASREIGNGVSSPGITIIRKDLFSFPGFDKDLLLLCQNSEGSDLRRLRFTGKTAYFCTLSGEWSIEETKSLPSKSKQIPIPVQGAGQVWRTILLMNNEIDVQLRNNQTASANASSKTRCP